MLKWCSKCGENSIAGKLRTRQRDGAEILYEYCINKNPSCQYRAAIIMKRGDKNANNKKTSQQQYELFG